MHQYTHNRDARPNAFVPALPDILDPPPDPKPVDSPAAPQLDVGLGCVVISANVLVTVVIVVGVWIDSSEAGRAILSGALYFGITTPVYVSMVTNTLTSVVATWQRERTERHRIDAYTDLSELALRYRIRVERNETLRLRQQVALPPPPADPPQGVSPSPRFVAPYADGDRAKQEAITWLAGLYGEDGLPDPRKVSTNGTPPGWLKIRMLGSTRGGGSREAGLWLLHQGIVQKHDRNYRLNLGRYPNRMTLRDLA
jgi:hypothetical protein